MPTSPIYPLNNIIFEDTATAILYQNGNRILTANMKDPARLSGLVAEFFRHIEPEIEEFEHAIDEFKERVPDLAEGLAGKIAKSHKDKPPFKKAFAIVRLVGQVIRVSVETVKIVKALPENFSDAQTLPASA